MYIDKKRMEELNLVQIDIFKNFVNVCNELNLHYFAVHGTLLGALRCKGFFPMDDDIDVAMPRKDYDTLIKMGQELLPNYLFIQSNETDPEYPLAFAKIRNTETAFIQPVLDNCDVNKGVYIDIFPIDYFPDNGVISKYKNFKGRLLNLRVCTVLNWPATTRHKIFQAISKIIMPSWENAVRRYVNNYKSDKSSSKIILFGGKSKEVGVPAQWFEKTLVFDFEGLKITGPAMYDEYLTRIYGDYMTYSPSEKYLNDKGEVEISADILDLNNSYRKYKGV